MLKVQLETMTDEVLIRHLIAALQAIRLRVVGPSRNAALDVDRIASEALRKVDAQTMMQAVKSAAKREE